MARSITSVVIVNGTDHDVGGDACCAGHYVYGGTDDRADASLQG